MGNGTYCKGKISITTQSEHIYKIFEKKNKFKENTPDKFRYFPFFETFKICLLYNTFH